MDPTNFDNITMTINAGTLARFVAEVKKVLEDSPVRHPILSYNIDRFEQHLTMQYALYLIAEKKRQQRRELAEAQRGPVTHKKKK